MLLWWAYGFLEERVEKGATFGRAAGLFSYAALLAPFMPFLHLYRRFLVDERESATSGGRWGVVKDVAAPFLVAYVLGEFLRLFFGLSLKHHLLYVGIPCAALAVAVLVCDLRSIDGSRQP
jgi:hypothetical protein